MTSRDFSPPESERILLVDVVAGELERAEDAAKDADRFEREVLLHLLPHREIGIEQIERLLREVAHLQAGAEAHAAFVGLQRAGDHLQQRRLPRAVLSHHAPALAAAHVKVEVVVDRLRAEALADVLERGHVVAGARRRAEVELHDLARLRRLDALDLVERLDAALHLRRLRGVRGEAIDEALLLRQLGLLARVMPLPGSGRAARARGRRSRSCRSR